MALCAALYPCLGTMLGTILSNTSFKRTSGSLGQCPIHTWALGLWCGASVSAVLASVPMSLNKSAMPHFSPHSTHIYRPTVPLYKSLDLKTSAEYGFVSVPPHSSPPCSPPKCNKPRTFQCSPGWSPQCLLGPVPPPAAWRASLQPSPEGADPRHHLHLQKGSTSVMQVLSAPCNCS